MKFKCKCNKEHNTSRFEKIKCECGREYKCDDNPSGVYVEQTKMLDNEKSIFQYVDEIENSTIGYSSCA